MWTVGEDQSMHLKRFTAWLSCPAHIGEHVLTSAMTTKAISGTWENSEKLFSKIATINRKWLVVF